ncbi:MAG: hypothetical protein GYB53_18625 [Rhodobacteraceae bacterium]|nr:hypothetical protein [Paracoccaceae bacterium]MBR9819686.1 hypothetical protein [Paracoccaceae bacterium]
MTFSRMQILMFLFRNNRRAAAERGRRWARAFHADRRLAHDLVELSGLLALPPERLANGVVQPDPIDPIRMAQERGERAMAVKLLALMGVSTEDLNNLMMEPQDEYLADERD